MTAKQTFRRVGWSLLTAVGSLTVISIVLGAALAVIKPDYMESPWTAWLTSFLPVYLAALPLGYAVLAAVPGEKQNQMRLGAKNFFVFLLICFPIMYGGNLLGTLLSMLLSGGAAKNPLENFAFDSNPLKLLVTVLAAPAFEELFFRKVLIDRTVRYGEKTAILVSAVAFALFHGNFFQLFYAFGLGLVFAYVYVRTRRIRYSMLLHMIVNFMGMVVGPFFVSKLDMDLLEQMQSGAMDEQAMLAALPSLSGFVLYALVLFGVSVAGLILLILRAGKLVFHTAEEELPKEERFKTVWVNVGMILFVVVSIGLCVASLIVAK